MIKSMKSHTALHCSFAGQSVGGHHNSGTGYAVLKHKNVACVFYAKANSTTQLSERSSLADMHQISHTAMPIRNGTLTR